MSQHFLLSSKARSLSIINIVKMSDMEAFEVFKAIRWNESNAYDDLTAHYDMNRVK